MQKYSNKLPTIKQMQYFLAVCDELNFRKAAAKLCISQPPLSLQIRELEARLNTKLIIRDTQHVVLTKQGELFRERAEALLQRMMLIIDELQADTQQKVNIGMTRTLGFEFIPIFKQFLADFSHNITLYKDFYTSKELLSELSKKNMDFTFVSFEPQQTDNLCYRLVHQEPMVVALPACHPASHKTLLDLNDVLDLPLYWFNRYMNAAYYDQCEKVFRKLTLPLIRRTELPDTLSMLLDISLGNGMLFMPLSNSQAEIPGVVYKRFNAYFEKKFLVDIFLVWHPQSTLKHNGQKILHYFGC